MNLDTGEEKRYAVPGEVKGSNALTSSVDCIVFHAPYEDEKGIYKWRPGDKKAERIGKYIGGLRGLKNGRFISTGQKGFTILNLN